MSAYTAESLHFESMNVGISEAEDILLCAYHDIQRAEKDPEHFRMIDFFRVLRGMVANLRSGDELNGDDPEDADIARAIFARLKQRAEESTQ